MDVMQKCEVLALSCCNIGEYDTDIAIPSHTTLKTLKLVDCMFRSRLLNKKKLVIPKLDLREFSADILYEYIEPSKITELHIEEEDV